MPLPQVVDGLVKRYERSAVLRALVQIIPFNIGSAIDTAVLTKVQSIRAERATIFFDELASGQQTLTPELLENNDFLHCFFATTDAALKANRAEKIQYLARLLASSTIDGKFSNVDEYEEYLGSLDELSNREFAVLVLLDQYETKFPMQEGENQLQCANRFWSQFSDELVSRFLIPNEEMDALLTRLNRSGCYETFIGNYLSYTGGKGKTTPTFHRLKSLVIGTNIHDS